MLGMAWQNIKTESVYDLSFSIISCDKQFRLPSMVIDSFLVKRQLYVCVCVCVRACVKERVLESERRKRHVDELRDTESRRHSDNIKYSSCVHL